MSIIYSLLHACTYQFFHISSPIFTFSMSSFQPPWPFWSSRTPVKSLLTLTLSPTLKCLETSMTCYSVHRKKAHTLCKALSLGRIVNEGLAKFEGNFCKEDRCMRQCPAKSPSVVKSNSFSNLNKTKVTHALVYMANYKFS